MKTEAKYEFGTLRIKPVFNSAQEEAMYYKNMDDLEFWCGSMDYYTCMTYVGECRAHQHIKTSIPDFRPRKIEPIKEEDEDDIPF